MKKYLPVLIGLAWVSATLPTAVLGADMKYTPEMATTMDENKDGMISKAEYLKHSSDAKKWAAMDKNKDDMLDAGEIKTGFNDKS